MNNIHTAAIDTSVKRLQLKEITILLTASIFIPLVIHLIPSGNGIPLGAVLLPMFYVPLIAVIFHKFGTALIVTALGPILNYLITGSPKLEKVPFVTLEVLLFVLMLVVLLKYKKLNKVSSLISILFAFLISSLVFGLFSTSGFAASHYISILETSIPGIIILTVMNILLLRLREKL